MMEDFTLHYVIEPTIIWVSSGFSGYIWLDTNYWVKSGASAKSFKFSECKLDKVTR